MPPVARAYRAADLSTFTESSLRLPDGLEIHAETSTFTVLLSTVALAGTR